MRMLRVKFVLAVLAAALLAASTVAPTRAMADPGHSTNE